MTPGTRPPGDGHDHGPHHSEHHHGGGGLRGTLAELRHPHRHDHAATVDDALLADRTGRRTLAVSLAGLLLAGAVQAVIVARIERTVTQVMAELLDTDLDQLDPSRSFFELGLTSLALVRASFGRSSADDALIAAARHRGRLRRVSRSVHR
jgi:hypothetical protein